MKLNTETFIQKAKLIHRNNFDYSELKYINSTTKITIICNTCKFKNQVLPHSHLKSGCKKCLYVKQSKKLTWSNEKFLIEAKKVHGDKFEYLTEYKNKRTKIKIKCIACNRTFLQEAGSHIRGYGCIKCNLSPKCLPITILEFEERCKKVHNDIYEYFSDYKGYAYKVKIFCKQHKETFEQQAGSHLNGSGCPKCRLSKGELKIAQFLTENSIEYLQNKKFNDCKNKKLLPFDFYLPNLNTCIEYDGEQHFYAIKYYGGKKRFAECQKNDKIKNQFCKDNNINLIRIPFFEFNNIETILQIQLFNCP